MPAVGLYWALSTVVAAIILRALAPMPQWLAFVLTMLWFIGQTAAIPKVAMRWTRSGGRRESHPPAPTDPGVTVSRHRALVTLLTRRLWTQRQCRNMRGYPEVISASFRRAARVAS